MAPSASGLPDDKSSWRKAWEKTTSKVEGQSWKKSSASKIIYEQFLQLRVLWKVRDINFLRDNQGRFGLSDADFVKASSHLDRLKSWTAYLSCLSASGALPCPLPESLGVFALVLVHQKDVTKSFENEMEHQKDVTKNSENEVEHQKDVTKNFEHELEHEICGEGGRHGPRLRPRTAATVEPDSPSHHPSSRRLFNREKDSDPATTTLALTGDFETISLEDSSFSPCTPPAQSSALTPKSALTGEFETSSLEDSPFSPRTPLAGSRALIEAMFPRAIDEQIVNTALIDFLQALTIHLPCTAEWSLHRKAFRIGPGFVARVDGYLKIPGTNFIKAIVEVKAAIRNDEFEGSRVRMQEGAQMAAWIYSDEQEEGCTISSAGKRRRILISQDRHHIFVSFASYGEAYINHLRPLPDGEERIKRSKSKSANIFEGLGQPKEINSKHTLRRDGNRGRLRDRIANNSQPNMQDDDSPFLVMDEIGPFDTEDPKQMKELGCLIVALVFQAIAET